jgi:serine/threonine-protein kinase haspin
VDGNSKVNGEAQKSLLEIVPEILIAQELSGLRGGVEGLGSPGDSASVFATDCYIQVLQVTLVYGQMPTCLLAAWDEWNGADGRSENDRPDFFPVRQLFLVFEFADGGLDLERHIFASFQECQSVVAQVSLALAVAEISLHFEHRDLHIGNVLVKQTDEEWVEFVLDSSPLRVRSHGVHVHIIDFTNSRLAKNGCTIFVNLGEDKELFNGTASEYQFEVYRLMRADNGNDWKRYQPRSNLLWIHYLLDHFLSTRCFLPKSSKAKSSAVALRGQNKAALEALKDDVLSFPSATFLVLGLGEEKLLGIQPFFHNLLSKSSRAL